MFDLRSLRLSAGEQHRQRLPVTIAEFTVGGAPYVAVPDVVDAAFAVTRLRNGWVFDERFGVEVHGPCHRCLEDAAVALDITAQEFHTLDPELAQDEDMVSPYLSEDDQLDTDRMASDAVILAMPVQVLCRDDCAGLCPRCGANLNEGPCSCPPEQPDERWSKLRELL
jgi:DUF177 domain-containing protein